MATWPVRDGMGGISCWPEPPFSHQLGLDDASRKGRASTNTSHLMDEALLTREEGRGKRYHERQHTERDGTDKRTNPTDRAQEVMEGWRDEQCIFIVGKLCLERVNSI